MTITVTNTFGRKKVAMVIFKMDVWTMMIHHFLNQGATVGGIENLKIYADGVELKRPDSFEMED